MSEVSQSRGAVPRCVPLPPPCPPRQPEPPFQILCHQVPEKTEEPSDLNNSCPSPLPLLKGRALCGVSAGAPLYPSCCLLRPQNTWYVVERAGRTVAKCRMRQAQVAVWVSEASGGGVRVMRSEGRLELCMTPVVSAMIYSGGIDGRY
ncbi:hypothetical protein E2C01_038577 [Portunus trituberculatus]|uniref:Uncharacterized protein n=1 Tax=Portunus trituberculatus TaxID=210409 RepID=A0A5B7FHJ9_PORTR|nr:hypothetical protein [Portunus trituberculatus]